MDPDDLIKAQGPAAMQKVLDDAQPMVNLLVAARNRRPGL